MTEAEAIALEPRELDALMAEVVFEIGPDQWEPPCFWHHSTDCAEKDEVLGWTGWCYDCNKSISEVAGSPRRYSTTWSGLGLVVERMEADGWHYTLESRWDPIEGRIRQRAEFGRAGKEDEDIWIRFEAWADDIKEAAALAALKARGAAE